MKLPSVPASAAAQGLSLDNPHDQGLAPSALPAWLQWAMIGAVVLGVAVSGILSISEHWRRATFMLGASLVWLSLVRLTCDSTKVGVLAVRSRKFDAAFSAALGAGMLFLAASVDSLGS